MVDTSPIGVCAVRRILGRTHLFLVPCDGELAHQVPYPSVLGMANVSQSDPFFPRTRLGRLHPPQHPKPHQLRFEPLHAILWRRTHTLRTDT